MSESPVIFEKPKVVPREKVAEPSMYSVILHNDSMTPRGFVVIALKQCFNKVEREANTIMQEAHEEGSAVVATFSREIAEVKAAKGNDFSAKHGQVLLFTAEKQN